MQRQIITVLALSCVLTAVAYAQTASPGAPVPPPTRAAKRATAAGNASGGTSSANPSAVGMDQPVITLKGGCEPIGDITPSKDCVSTVTRAQFEKITNALQPDMAADAKRGFATNYGRLLIFSDAARALHLENDPNVQQIIQFVSQQVMAEGLKRHYTEQFAHPSDQQIQDYYNQEQRQVSGSHFATNHHPEQPGNGRQASSKRCRSGRCCGKDSAALGCWRRSGQTAAISLRSGRRHRSFYARNQSGSQAARQSAREPGRGISTQGGRSFSGPSVIRRQPFIYKVVSVTSDPSERSQGLDRQDPAAAAIAGQVGSDWKIRHAGVERRVFRTSAG